MKKLISLQLTLVIIAILFAFMPPARAQKKENKGNDKAVPVFKDCLLYTSPSPRDRS